MMIRRIKERFKRLQTGRARFLVALVGTIQQSIKYLSPICIYIDKDGDWYNYRKDITFVSPELNVTSLNQAESNVLDFWLVSWLPTATRRYCD